MKSFNNLALCVASATLAGCGGSGSTPFTVDSFERDFEAIAGASITDFTTSPADPNTLSGTASFSGVALFPTTLEADEALLGQFVLNADFASGALTGSADEFSLYDIDFATAEAFGDAFMRREDLSGRLSVSSGETLRDVFGPGDAQLLTGDLVGTLAGSDGAYEVDVDFLGVIADSATSDGLIVNGSFLGTVDTPASSITYGSESGIVGAIILAGER